MGVVNVTPDSFSDGGRYFDPSRALAHARALVADGADIVDIGGESTRPGAAPVSEAEELERVLPIVEALANERRDRQHRHDEARRHARGDRRRRVDGQRRARAAGAGRARGGAAARRRGLPHAHAGRAAHDAAGAAYDDVVREVGDFLLARAQACEEAGIARERIVIDPGFGFGKTVEHNLELLRRLAEIVALGYPVLAGLSRKATHRPADRTRRRRADGGQRRRGARGGRARRVDRARARRARDRGRARGVGAIVNAVERAQSVCVHNRSRSCNANSSEPTASAGASAQPPITPELVLKLGWAAGRTLVSQEASTRAATGPAC